MLSWTIRAAGRRSGTDLTEILMALYAVLCGAGSGVDVAEWAEDSEAWLKRYLVLEHGTPSHDTFSRMFRLLDAKAFIIRKAFEACFRDWIAEMARQWLKGPPSMARPPAVFAMALIVRAIETPPGATHDTVLADRLIERAPAKAVYADATYCNKGRRQRLREQGIKPRIRFNPRAGVLISRQRALNIQWAKVRAGVEDMRRLESTAQPEDEERPALHTLLAMVHRRWSKLAA